MRAVVITKHGGPGVLKVQERPDPPLGPGEVRIDVAAAGINFADIMARLGFYPDAPKTPCVVGYEVAGTILELGEGASSPAHPLSVGQRVFVSTFFGGYASQVVVPAIDVFALPDELSFAQGAAIPVNYATAWASLMDYGDLQPGGARSDPLGWWRRRHRRHADRQAGGRRGLRHRVAWKACSHRRAGRRPRPRLHQVWLGARPAEVRRDHGRRRRRELPAQLRPAAPWGAPGGVRRLCRCLRAAQKPHHGVAHGRADAALQHDQADV